MSENTDFMKQMLLHVADRRDLSYEEAKKTMHALMSGDVPEAQIASLLTALYMKGETADEITAFAQTMREFCIKITPPSDGPILDVCGTGGAKIKTFNISTASAFVVAGAGVTVAKHGNRSSTGACGSADVLEALGADLFIEPKKVEKIISDIGVGFLFAQKFHPAMKHVAPVRKAIGIRTVFNMLGPLTNPASANRQIIGVYDKALVEKITPVLPKLGIAHGLVFHGLDGIDELSTVGETYVGEVKNGALRYYSLTPYDFGIPFAKVTDIMMQDPIKSAETFRAVLSGKTGPKRDAVLLNAAAGLYVGDVVNSIERGLEKASDSIDSGAALKKLDSFIAATRASHE